MVAGNCNRVWDIARTRGRGGAAIAASDTTATRGTRVRGLDLDSLDTVATLGVDDLVGELVDAPAEGVVVAYAVD